VSKRLSKNAVRPRPPVTKSMYNALLRDVERLTESNEKLAYECATNARRCGELQRDLDVLRRLVQGI